ncbi:MAG: MC/SLC25 family protein [Alphaproteobacteria bacterium]
MTEQNLIEVIKIKKFKEIIKKGKIRLSENFDLLYVKTLHNPSAQIFALSGGIGALQVLLTHPIYLLKTLIQIDRTKSSSEYIKDITRHDGIRALWRGVIPAMARVTAKDGINGMFLHVNEKIMFSSITAEYKNIANISSGLLISTFNTFFTNPIENIITQKITNKNKITIKEIVANTKSKIFTLGLEANFYKTFLNWATFLSCDDYINKNFESKSSTFNIFASAVISGSIITLITNPFDVIKTQQQSFKEKKDASTIKNVYKTAVEIAKTQGVRQFSSGGLYRLGLNILGTAGTSTVRNWTKHIVEKQEDTQINR